MATDIAGAIGGVMLGMTQGKAEAQQRQMMEDYRKAQVDEIKLRAKLEENKLNMEQQKFNLFKPLLEQAMGGGMPSPPAAGAPMGGAPPMPGVMGREIAPPSQKPFEQMAAEMSTPGIQMSPAGQKSTRFNNPYNVEYRPWQDKYGATMGADNRFGQYPNPAAGVAATTDLIQQYAKQGKTLAQAIETFAPTSENPNTPQRIRETARVLGVNPNTPLADIPLGPFMTTHVKYESPTQISPSVFGQYANVPIGQTIGINPVLAAAGGQPQQQQGPQPLGQRPPQLPTQAPERQITQKDVLAAGWKWLTGSDLKDEKYDYRMTPNKDVMVLKDGNAIKLIPTGPDIDIKVLDNGDWAFYDRKAQAITKVIGTPPKMEKVTGTTPDGRPYIGFQPVPKYPGQGGLGSPQGMFSGGGQEQNQIPPGLTGGMFTGPGTKEKAQKIPEAIDQKIANEYDPIINELTGLKDYANKKKDVFGLWNQMKFAGAESPSLRAGMDVAGVKVTSDLIDFYKSLSRVQNLEVHAFGGSNLTVQELRRALTQLPRANNPEDFKVATDTVLRAYKNYKDSIYDFYSKTEDQRTREALAPTAPLATGGPVKVFEENGVKKMIGPDGKKYRWVE